MRSAAVAIVLHLLTGLTAGAQSPITPEDSAAVRATALDYIDGWYAGDGERMRRALHPDLAKRVVRGGRLEHMGADTLVSFTRRGGGRRTAPQLRRNDVRILDMFGNAASVRVDATEWVDYLHLARIGGRWLVVNVLWELRAEP